MTIRLSSPNSAVYTCLCTWNLLDSVDHHISHITIIMTGLQLGLIYISNIGLQLNLKPKHLISAQYKNKWKKMKQ